MRSAVVFCVLCCAFQCVLWRLMAYQLQSNCRVKSEQTVGCHRQAVRQATSADFPAFQSSFPPPLTQKGTPPKPEMPFYTSTVFIIILGGEISSVFAFHPFPHGLHNVCVCALPCRFRRCFDCFKFFRQNPQRECFKLCQIPRVALQMRLGRHRITYTRQLYHTSAIHTIM